MEKKNRTKIEKIVSGAVFILLLILECWAVISIYRLNMLPAQLFAILFIVLAILTGVIGFLLFGQAGNCQKPCRWKKLTAYLLSAVIIVVCIIGSPVAAKIRQTIDIITQKPTVSARIGVYVLTDDPAESLDHAQAYTFGIADSYDADNTKSVLDAMEQALKKAPKTRSYQTVFQMVEGLYNGEIEAMILNDAYISVLEELDRYRDFSSETKLLFEYSVQEPIVPSDGDSSPADRPKPDTVVSDPFIIYLSGSDTRSALLDSSRSDVNILAAVNPKNKQILLVNTPRDYYIPNPAGGGAKDKLTHCGLYGTDCSIEALSQLYGQQISYYAQINFAGFETLIDAIGGVNITSDIAFTTTHGNYYIEAGENHLNGIQALGFARERYAFSDGDNARGRNQMKVVSAVIDKLASPDIIMNYSDILTSLQGMFVTDISSGEISKLVKMQLSDMAAWEVFSYAAKGFDGNEIPYSMPGIYAYVMYPDEETVDHAAALLDQVMSGRRLTGKDVEGF